MFTPVTVTRQTRVRIVLKVDEEDFFRAFCPNLEFLINVLVTFSNTKNLLGFGKVWLRNSLVRYHFIYCPTLKKLILLCLVIIMKTGGLEIIKTGGLETESGGRGGVREPPRVREHPPLPPDSVSIPPVFVLRSHPLVSV